MAKVPLAPDCAKIRPIARQSGWDEVDVADGVGRDEDVGDGMGVCAAVVLGVLVDVEDSVFMAVTELVIAAVNEPVNVALPDTVDEIVALLVAVDEGDEDRLRMLAMLRPR